MYTSIAFKNNRLGKNWETIDFGEIKINNHNDTGNNNVWKIGLL